MRDIERMKETEGKERQFYTVKSRWTKIYTMIIYQIISCLNVLSLFLGYIISQGCK